MNIRSSYRLVIESRAGYAERLAALCEKLASFRSEEAIDWQSRIESWLRNISGFADQEIALGMLEKVRVVSHADEIKGCSALLDELRKYVKAGATLYHLGHFTSGNLLTRILEKKLKVNSSEILRPASFTRDGPIKPGDVIAMWDRFNGSGTQLKEQLDIYSKLLDQLGKKPQALRLAYLAGHPLREPLPTGVFLHRWITDIPTVTDNERDLCSRYLEASGGAAGGQRFETGALITFSDNIPNNVPHVLCARETSTWAPLLDREGTRGSKRPTARKK